MLRVCIRGQARSFRLGVRGETLPPNPCGTASKSLTPSGPQFPCIYTKSTGFDVIQGLPSSDNPLGQEWGWSGVTWLWGAVPPVPRGTYPVKDVFKAVWAGDVEAEEQDAGVRVEQGPQAVIVDLSW